MYHAVSDNLWGDTTLFVSIKNFELQMKYLYNNGYTPSVSYTHLTLPTRYSV